MVYYLPIKRDEILMQANCVAQVGYKLLIFLPLPPRCWDYTFAPLYQAAKILILLENPLQCASVPLSPEGGRGHQQCTYSNNFTSRRQPCGVARNMGLSGGKKKNPCSFLASQSINSKKKYRIQTNNSS
jgi:hypothetical protein